MANKIHLKEIFIVFLLILQFSCSNSFEVRNNNTQENKDPSIDSDQSLLQLDTKLSCPQQIVSWGTGCKAVAKSASEHTDKLNQVIIDSSGLDGFLGSAQLLCIDQRWEVTNESVCHRVLTNFGDDSNNSSNNITNVNQNQFELNDKTSTLTVSSNVIDFGETPFNWVNSQGISGNSISKSLNLNINWVSGNSRVLEFSNSSPFYFPYSSNNLTISQKGTIPNLTINFSELDIPNDTRDGTIIQKVLTISPERNYYFNNGVENITLKIKLNCYNNGNIWSSSLLKCTSGNQSQNNSVANNTNQVNLTSQTPLQTQPSVSRDCASETLNWGNHCSALADSTKHGINRSIFDSSPDSLGYVGRLSVRCINGQFEINNQTCTNTNEKVMGKVDGIGHNAIGRAVIVGWAFDPDDPIGNVVLSFESAGLTSTGAQANLPSEDVNNALIAMGISVSGNHRFEWLVNSQGHIGEEVRVYGRELLTPQLPKVLLGTVGPVFNQCKYYLRGQYQVTEFVNLYKKLRGDDLFYYCESQNNLGFNSKFDCVKDFVIKHGEENQMCIR